MATAKKTTDATAPAYDPAKRYGVRLSKVVEFEGFTLKPGPEPIEMSGEWAALHADAIAEATELPESAAQPVPVEQVHEIAER